MHHGDVSPEIAQGLLPLRERIAAAKIPPCQLDETIPVALSNIREFGKVRRTEAASHFSAEILSECPAASEPPRCRLGPRAELRATSPPLRTRSPA